MPNTSLHTPPEHKMHEGAHLKNLTHPTVQYARGTRQARTIRNWYELFVTV